MHRNEKYQLVGWLLFIACSIFYIISSIQNGDTMVLLGSILFLAACILFLMPLLSPKRK